MENYKDARISAMQKRLEWYNMIVDYISIKHQEVYNEACIYVDKIQNYD